MDKFADHENIAVESMRIYSPFSVSFLITTMHLSCGSDESIDDIDVEEIVSSRTLERYVFS